MSTKPRRKSISILVISSLAPIAFAASPSEKQIELQKEGIEMIGQVADSARDIRYQADRLKSFTRSIMISKWTHHHHLLEIKSLVNDGLQPALQRLTEIQPQLPDWKQQSIDDMMVAAKALAGDANSAILSKKDAGTVPPALNSEYKDLVGKIYQHADTLVKTADAAMAYASGLKTASKTASAR